MFFFERTAQDSAHFIDIEEKNKTAALGSHRQGTKGKKKQRLARLDWDINTGYRSPAVCTGTSTRPHY
jgi:hypothetical protein